MSAIRCGAAAAVDSCGGASACSVNGGEGGAAEAAAEAAVASRDVRARWARYARSSSAVFRSRLRSCACEGGGVGGVHLGRRAALGVCACLDGGLQVVDPIVLGAHLSIAEEARGHWKLRLGLQYRTAALSACCRSSHTFMHDLKTSSRRASENSGHALA